MSEATPETPDAPKTYPPGPPAEAERRRPDFRDGTAIVLSDGNPWVFPLPELQDFYFHEDAKGDVRMARGTSCGPEFDAILDAYVDAETSWDELCALAKAALFLLRKNYDLTPDDARFILRRARADSPDAEASNAMWREVGNVLTGVPKKEVTSVG